MLSVIIRTLSGCRVAVVITLLTGATAPGYHDLLRLPMVILRQVISAGSARTASAGWLICAEKPFVGRWLALPALAEKLNTLSPVPQRNYVIVKLILFLLIKMRLPLVSQVENVPD
ncbi:hypothetical protein BL250_00855 [Erwinia sp. OLTSP20]|nr:hypothetical protein BV501_15600 [Erwinia sp. OAMSP11]PIJ69339.1 hypothetical protein BK416_14540 [Erwinia sp. OLSSP12]PIJ79173.1 hypothetical protein BLD47_14845 [Erwinia sp. OLCASP19]PIJ80699.1 hypothetical protein BLD46_14005 [Erwinia sp. OLMTSP26]PIJ82849.1 hypothetical protein BLD49_13900 [Erwinia sp. OLMDSP33]PIJ91703.1 hypothetical protein BL249_07710 [Erwinia sp. OLFS4]PIJ95323.1 hypothetical protein BL250_00855 [Erwinia sp. OLTSP20]